MSIRILESVCTDMVQNPESISRNIKENGSLFFLMDLLVSSFYLESLSQEIAIGSRSLKGVESFMVFFFDGGADIKFPA